MCVNERVNVEVKKRELICHFDSASASDRVHFYLEDKYACLLV